MAYDDPRWMGGIGMIGTKAVYDAVMHCDLLLMARHRLSVLGIPADQAVVVQIDERAECLGGGRRRCSASSARCGRR